MRGLILITDIIALILSIALELGIDGNLALALANKENETLDRYAFHNNYDMAGNLLSVDMGIMQLNSKSIPSFLKLYWDRDEEFDIWYAEHNIFIGLRHLKHLLTECGFNEWQAILAYNCGEYAVKKGNVPNSSIEYANYIYTRWKGEKQ
jgi:hypothetical protein